MRPEQQHERLYALLGDLPERHRTIAARLISQETRDGYTLEKLLLDLNGIEPAPAYLCSPNRDGCHAR